MVMQRGFMYLQASDALRGHPCVRTVGKIIREHHQHGYTRSLSGRLGLHNAGRRFDGLATNVLGDLVDTDQSRSLMDIAIGMSTALGEHWTEPAVSKALKESGYVRVITMNALESCDAKRVRFRENLRHHGVMAACCSFGDEMSAGRLCALSAAGW
ncbi:hypothetical protein FOA52_001289 [Chlamydomonas sp. UWO 241]|nr:hypothetical protein FOA52_001289 [Chlamydomonas sp. UWO 241]